MRERAGTVPCSQGRVKANRETFRDPTETQDVRTGSAWLARTMIHEGAARLHAAGMDQARHEAEWLLSRFVGVRPLDVYLQETPISDEIAQRFFMNIEARASGAPLQYLLGEAEFFGAPFTVAPGVFIPRPETETIVERVLLSLRARSATLQRPLRLLDLGTGSGCIAVTLARELPACIVVGVELSWKALCVAKRNVLRHRLLSRVQLVQGCWMESLRGEFDGVISNPPYVPSDQVDRLPLDVRQEPRLSLDGGDDGMRDLRQLMAQAPTALCPGGLLAFECGEEQVDELMREVSGAPWVGVARPLHDLAERPRGILVTKRW